jgi:hypothetical protein
MRTALLFLAVTMLTMSHSARADDDPFAPAKTGKLECFAPNSENKTCLDMTRYTWEANGQILEEDEYAISANPLITAKSRDHVEIAHGEACQVVSEQKILGANYFRDRARVSESDEAQFRQRDLRQMSSFVGKRLCMSLSPYESLFIAEYSIDGIPRPSATNRLKWISPDEGYVLAPQ